MEGGRGHFWFLHLVLKRVSITAGTSLFPLLVLMGHLLVARVPAVTWTWILPLQSEQCGQGDR